MRTRARVKVVRSRVRVSDTNIQYRVINFVLFALLSTLSLLYEYGVCRSVTVVI